MKKIFYTLCMFFLISCADNHTTETSHTSPTDTLQAYTKVNEEVFFENSYFKIVKVNQDEFDKETKSIHYLDTAIQDFNIIELAALKKCKECKRIDGYTLKIGNKTFKNQGENLNDTLTVPGDDLTKYFLYDYADGLAFIKVLYYESSANIVYDIAKNQQIDLWGYPVYLPAKNAMFVSNMDLIAGFEINGLQFVAKNKDKWLLVWEQETDFGLHKMFKINDSTIYAHKITINYSDSGEMNEEEEPVKIIIK